MMTLESVLPILGKAYDDWKGHEKIKNQYKDEFFKLADDAIVQRGQATKVTKVNANSLEVALERVQRHYPTWEVQEQRPGEGNAWEFILVENPRLTAFLIEHDGVKYARTIRKGAVMVDDEWLREEDPDLYEEITYELPWGDRITVPIEHLDKEIIGQLTKYLYNAKPTAALAAPTKVKE